MTSQKFLTSPLTVCTCRDKSRGTPLSKRGCLYKGPFPQDSGYSVSMKVGVFIIASLYNDGFLFAAELSEVGLCELKGLWKEGHTGFYKVKGG